MVRCRLGGPWLSRLALLLPIAASTFAARPAHAQPILYVVDGPNNRIGEYNAVTGAPINPALVNGQGLNQAVGLVLTTDNRLLVSNPGNNTVGEYDATTGATINANFIPNFNAPRGLALDANNHLFVVGQAVGEFDATTGATINASFISGSQLGIPVAALIDGHGHIFVTNGPGGKVGEYDATTGATINSSFISGLNTANGMALDALGHLFVSENPGINDGAVAECDAITGAIIEPNFITGLNRPGFLAFDNSNHLFVGYGPGGGNGNVGEYDAATGASINTTFIGGFNNPGGIVFFVSEPGSLALVSSAITGAVALASRWRRRMSNSTETGAAPSGRK